MVQKEKRGEEVGAKIGTRRKGEGWD